MSLQNIYQWHWPQSKSSQLVLALSGLVFLIGTASASDTQAQQCVCKVGVPCEKNATALDCPSGRVISRRDCTCCFVCAKQLTESCNDSEFPCDTAFGLICGEDSRCKALKSCSDDTQCSSNQQCIGGACAEVCKVRPNVCKDEGVPNGVCTVRNHRAFCSCPNGLTLNSNHECVSAREEGIHCLFNGRKLAPGEKSYMQNCGKQCECEETGEIHCQDLKEPPHCGNGFIAMSKITGEMNDACKILIGNETVFDGCCVPETCRNVTSQDDTKGGRDFKLSESHNNLGDDEEDATRPRDMLISRDDSDKKVSAEADKTKNPKKPLISSSAPTLIPSSSIESDSTREDHENMGITISSITSHSALVNLPKNSKEAILSIALSSELAKLSEKKTERAESFVWRTHRIPPILPFLTLSDLLSNTSYTVKYSVGEKTYPTVEFRTLGEETMQTPAASSSDELPPTAASVLHSSENATIEVTTTSTTTTTAKAIIDEPGCIYNDTHYTIGSTFYEGCEKKCECMKNGQMKCMDPCTIPFFHKGSFAHDKMCFEEPSGFDDCCVIVACARATSGSGEPRELSLNPCDSAKCGKMAECRSEVSPSEMHSESQETLCVCKDGYTGDPYDEVTGCEQVASTPAPTSSSLVNPIIEPTANKSDGCAYNNKTYGYGEEFLDGCSYKCHCEASGEVLCRPRCSYRADEQEELREGCHHEKDPADPDCCERLVCAGETLEAKKDKPTPVPVNGCVYKNNTYEKDEKFYDGCEQQCMCFSNGDVTCQPRCPPAGPSVEKDCITLPDPVDSCCTVTVCGNNTISDVMKAANETQARNKVTTTEMARLLREEDGTTAHSSHERTSLEAKDLPSKLTIKIASLTPINSTSLMLSIQIHQDHLPVVSDEKITIEYSQNQTTWDSVEASIKELFVEGSDEIHTIIHSLVPGKKYYFRANVNGTESNTVSGSTSKSDDLAGSEEGSSLENQSISSGEAVCTYKGKMFAAQEEWYDGCELYCMCKESGAVHCEPIECPNEDGLELVDPHCVKWEPVTEKDPPNCCPEMRCVQNTSCIYEGKQYENLEEVPVNITGCEKRCSCFFGNVSCTDRCIPIPATPPPSLRCPAESAIRTKLEYDSCCEAWSCKDQAVPIINGAHDQTLTRNKTQPSTNNTHHATSNIPLHIHHDISGEDDQFIPPSTGNEPTIVRLESLEPHQLQELLHQLSALAENGSPNEVGPFAKGTYLSVKNPLEAQEFERSGAKVIGEAEDGSFILFIPSPHGSNNVSDGRPRPHPDLPFPPHLHPGIQITAPDHFPFNPHDFGQAPIGHTTADEITGVTIRPLNETTLHIDFTVSPVLVGLHGAVEVRYTNEFKRKPNPDQWERQLFQQPEDVIDNSHLQLFLTGLRPDSEYHVQIQVLMTDLHTTPESDIFVIRTPPPAPLTTTLPPEIAIHDPEIKLMEVTSRSVEVSWRKFTDFETSLIDAVQVRYKAYDDQFYVTTPLIHRSISSYNLTNLHPNTKYEINLLLVPFPNQTTELKSDTPIHISTPADVDDYSFTISIETGKITDTTAELVLVGVPFPEDKFINIYQVIYQSDAEKEQKSSFKVAKRESSKMAAITGLKPGTKYRVWLEAFLTNGKKKRTEVIEVATKSTGSLGTHPQDINELGSHNQLQSDGRSEGSSEEPSSYYGALLALAIITALSITAIIILLMILIKKQNQATIPINDRKSESSYDNPSFKNYDIEANGHSKPGEL